MLFHVVLPLLLLLLLATALSSYIKFGIHIVLSDNDRFRGLHIRFRLLGRHFEKSYDYTDPRLHLWQVLTEDYWHLLSGDKVIWDWRRFQQILKRWPIIHTLADLSPVMKKILTYTVIERFTWQSRVGGSDAMRSALYAGIFWAVKGWSVTFLARHSRLRRARLAVRPNYVNAELVSEFDCILKMRIVHIIIIATYLTVWKVRWWINGFTANPREQPSY